MSISESEFARRYQAIRELMRKDGLDCLIIAGRADYFSRGNIRYVTNLALGGYAAFPLEGTPVYFLSAAQISSPKHRKAGPVHDLMEFKEIVNPLEQVRKELGGFDGGNKIGIVGITDIAVPVYLGLKETFRDRFVDATSIFASLRPIKSAEEVDRMRISASVADRVCIMLQETIRPGLVDYEIYGAVKKTIYEMGCDYSMELIDAEGSTMNMAWSPSGDRLAEKGTLFLEITPAYEGYYAQLPVTLPVGGYAPHVRKMVDVWAEAQEAGAALLRPGTPVSEVYRRAVGVVRERGFLSPFPPGHAIGLDAIDFWTINGSNETIIQPGMTVALHPCVLSGPGGEGVGMGYTYLVTETGAEKLSAIDLTQLG